MTTELIKLPITPKEIFVPKGLDPLLAGVREKVKEFKSETLDMEKKKDRDKVRSFASDIGKSKTFVDKARLKFVSDRKAALKVIDSECKAFRDTMDEIKIDAREPLTKWYAADKLRIEKERLQVEKDMDHEEALSMHDLFEREKAMALKEAEMAKQEEERLAKEEAEQAEKEKADNEARIKAEAVDKATREAADKIQNAKIKRITDLGLVYDGQQWKNDIAHIAVIDLQTLSDDEFDSLIIKIKAVLDKRDSDKAELEKTLASEKAKSDQEAAVQKAKDDAAAKVKSYQIEADRIAAEKKAIADKKSANTRHQAHVNNKIKENLMVSSGLTDEQATKVIIEVAQGRIEFMQINY